MSLQASIHIKGLGDVLVPTGLFIHVYHGVIGSFYSNNEWCSSSDNTTFWTVNPASGNKHLEYQHASKDDVNTAVKAARTAFKTTWGLNVPATARAKILFKVADLMERDIDRLSALESLDSGKGISVVKSVDVGGSVGTLRYYAGLADKMHGQAMTSYGKDKFVYTLNQPIGVCGQIIPWNFPLMMMCWKIAPALAAGCTVILKPSELTPLSALVMCELAKEAGLPAGALNVLPGHGATTGDAISRHMDIDKVAFTGSTSTGRRISIAAAESNLKKVSLELGGKSPVIVFDSADVEETADWVALGIWFNSGQTCCAGSRVYIQEAVYEDFLVALKKRGDTCAIGHPLDENTTFGPLISEEQRDKVINYIDAGRADGARVILGGKKWPQSEGGYWVEPTVLADTTSEMTVVKEEIFGPVIVAAPFRTEAEIIEAANDTPYGLAAAVFTNDTRQATRVCAAIDAGTVWCNQTSLVEFGAPFGGFKQSGTGRELGTYGLEAYLQVKAIHQNLSQKAAWP